MSSGGQLPWGPRGGISTFNSPGRGSGGARLVVMGAILVAIAILVWFIIGRVCSSGCSDEYCATELDVDAPEGFTYASDVYEYRGTPPEIPEGGTVEIDIALNGSVNEPHGLNFYRFLPDSSAWELISEATYDAENNRAVGSFSTIPTTLVVMQRTAPVGQIAAYVNPGEELHPEAVDRITMLQVRGLRPAGDGSVEGDVPRPAGAEDAGFYPVLEASAAIDGSLANVDAILASAETRTAHIRKIVEFIEARQLDGITISYLDLRADQRLSYGLFVEELSLELHRDGKVLVLNVPTPVRTTERIDTGGYDWEMLAGAADYITMMPMRDQRTYRSDMPAILASLQEVMDLRKLLLTVTPYAAERSPEGVRAITIAEAMAIATRISVGDADPETNSNIDIIGVNIDQNENLSGVLWDSSTATVAFTYKLDGNRTVWIENAFSVGFKLEFVSQFGLGGFAVEDASNAEFLGNIWEGIVPFVDSGTPQLVRPNAEDLAPRWSVSNGSFEGGAGGFIIWTTPSEPGSYIVSLTLSDGTAFFSSEIAVNVQPRQNGEASAGGG